MEEGFLGLNNQSNDVCFHIEYIGQVQGVGFRFTTYSIAKRYPVVGFVENMSNGRVLLIIQGKRSDVDKVLYEIDCYFSEHIEDRIQEEEPLRENLTQFVIHYK